jgi:hypothetical protein
MTTDALVEEMLAAAEDPDWLGSSEHLQLMQDYAQLRVPEASLSWLEEGAQSYSEGSKICVGLPEADSVDERCRLLAASLVHELSHIDYTDGSGRPAFDRARQMVVGSNYLYNLSEHLYQWLEDARIQVQEEAIHPEHAALIEQNYEASVRRLKETYTTSTGEELWESEPKISASQLWFAFAARILTGERGVTDEAVSDLLDAADPIIAAARKAPDANGSRKAALELTGLVGQRWKELT